MALQKLSILTIVIGLLFVLPTVAALPETAIIAELKVDGEHDSAGDTFTVTATVTNVGGQAALDVHGALQNVPDGWIVEPNTLLVNFGTIAPGQKAERTWKITRDEQDEIIAFEAGGANVNRAHSGRVNIPVNPLVLLALAGIALSSVARRRIAR